MQIGKQESAKQESAKQGSSEQHKVIFFDGVCHLCQASVRFIIARDPRATFQFASLQSEAAQRLLGGPVPVESVILWDEGRIYKRSAAALRIARSLRAPWPALSIFLLVPTFIRDAVYAWIAKNRYRWFGQDDQCWVPTPELKARFVE
ncbi:MAG TPA: thiol-disulfide oxidoreductase DCC family protein [Polyangiaceae bacterium]|nr:thiol-disulfide oxidoreductase DCC family protein [Polyangiaceae bacterium]